MPTPIDVQFATQTDGSGHAKIAQEIRSAAYTVVYATGQCNGSGQWLLGKGGNPLQFQQGANVVLGPLFLTPGQKAELEVVGATAGASMTGTFWGFQGEARDGSDLVALAASVESAGSLSGSVALSLAGNVPVVNAVGTKIATIMNQSQLSGSPFTAAAGTTTTVTFTPDVGAHAVAIILSNIGNVTNLLVTGATSGQPLLSVAPASRSVQPSLYIAPVVQAVDSQVVVAVTMPVAQTSTVYVASIDDAWAVALLSNVGTFPLGDAVGNGIGSSAGGPPNNLRVTNQGATPASWQAADQINHADVADSVATTTLRAAVVGQTIRVFGWQLEADQLSSGTVIAFLQDGSGNHIAALEAPSPGGSATGNLSGGPLPAGANSALVLNVAAAGTGGSVRAYVATSQV